jgi:hypothetical protein
MAEAASVVQGGDTAGGGSWADSLEPDIKPWVAGMGLDKLPEREALAKVLPMYRGAEQKLGVPADQVLRIPGEKATPEEIKAYRTKLGVPDSVDGYGIQAPEGHDGEFLKTASGWFHELGIPKTQAAGLAEKYNAHVQAAQAAELDKWNARHGTEINALKDTWKGDAYDKNLDLAQRVMRQAGFNDEQLKAMERALGPKALLEGFAKFGSSIGEHRFVGDGQNKAFGGGSIDDKIKALHADPEYMKDSVRGRQISAEIFALTQQDDRLVGKAA